MWVRSIENVRLEDSLSNGQATMRSTCLGKQRLGLSKQAPNCETLLILSTVHLPVHRSCSL